MTNRKQNNTELHKIYKRSFYVVQFIELPFKSVDDYVSVPGSWLAIRSSHNKTVVSYPNNEDPFDTRNRVKRRERPNDKWRFYMAYIKYKSDNFMDAECWIAMRNNHGPVQEESEIKGTQPESPLNRKLRSDNQSVRSVKPQQKIKSHKNPRKPLPRISIKRPLSQKPDKIWGYGKPVIDTGQKILASRCSKQDITENTSSISYAETITEQSNNNSLTQPPYALAGTKQTLTPKPVRQHLPNRTVEQKLSQHRPEEQQLSPGCQNYQESLIGSSQKVLPEFVTEKIPFVKLRSSTQRSGPQPQPVNKRSTTLVSYDNSSPEPQTAVVTAEQSLEANVSQKPEHRVLTKPNIVSKASSADSQPFQLFPTGHLRSPIPAIGNIQQEFICRNSTDAAYIRQKLLSQDNENSTTSILNNEYNRLTPQINPATFTKNISPIQYPPNTIIQLSSPGSSVIMQTAQKAQNNSQNAQIDGSLINSVRCCMEETCVDQRNPLFHRIINTSEAQNLLNLADQNRRFIGASNEQYYLPTHDENTQLNVRDQDRLKMPATVQSNQRVDHENYMINRGFVPQYQSHPIDRPNEFLPQNKNIYIPDNSFNIQEVIRHELMSRRNNEIHTIYNPNIQDTLIMPHYSSNQKYCNSKYSQQKQDLGDLQDTCTVVTQNNFPPKSNRSSLMSQRVTKRHSSPSFTSKTPSQGLSNAQRNCLLQKISIQERFQNFTKHRYMNQKVVPENLSLELRTQDSTFQAMPSSDRPHEMQSTSAQNNLAYQHTSTKKTMVDKTTETDSWIGVDNCIGTFDSPYDVDSALKLIDRACQIGECSREKQDSLYQETAQDPEICMEDEIEAENELVSEIIQKIPKNIKIHTLENQQVQSRKNVEQAYLSLELRTQDSTFQARPSSDRPHEMQSTSAQNHLAYQHTSTKKTMVDKTIETDSWIGVDNCIDTFDSPYDVDSALKLIDRACQIGECSREEQDSLYQETAQDPEICMEDEIESENELVSEINQKIPKNIKIHTLENQQVQSRKHAEWIRYTLH